MSESPHPIIQFDHATFGFPGVIALKDISLSIGTGEFVGVIGPNGREKRRSAVRSWASWLRLRAISVFLIVPAMSCAATTGPRSATSRRRESWIATFPSRSWKPS